MKKKKSNKLRYSEETCVRAQEGKPRIKSARTQKYADNPLRICAYLKTLRCQT